MLYSPISIWVGDRMLLRAGGKTMGELKAKSEKCKDYLVKMLKELKEYQREFSTWANEINDNFGSMTKTLKDEAFKEILSFSSCRKRFLDKKIRQIEKYIEIIQRESQQMDSYDFVDADFMDFKLKYILLSLGYCLF